MDYKIGVYQESAEVTPRHAFTAHIIGGEINFPEEEIMDVAWFTLEEIHAMENKLRNPWVLEAIMVKERHGRTI